MSPEPTSHPTSSLKRSHSGPLFLCSHHPSARYQTTPDGPSTPEPNEIIHICPPKPADPALPSPPTETTVKTSAQIYYSLSPCL